MTQGTAERASYGPCLLLFCVSVSWRVSVHRINRKGISRVPAALLLSAERAELTWREFLLGNRSHLEARENT
jgi:hypothetical protein